MKDDTEISIKEWLQKLDNGEFDDPSFKTMCDSGWYDWFCKESGLLGRLKRMTPKVRRIAKSPKIDPDALYVFFKNNCPMYGDFKLYDDFRLCSMETGDVVYTIVPRDPYGDAVLWGKNQSGEWGEVVRGKMKNVYEYFGV